MFRFLGILFSIVFLLAIAAAAGGFYILWNYGRALPDYRQLADYEPPVMSRIHAADGRLMDEYAREHRLFVPIAAIPRQVVHAVLAAEDKKFYSHPGIDPVGIARALLTNLRNYGVDRRPVGASTITQQVAKNFLLTNEVSVTRKIKEAILAFRIERAFTKDRILELYLNEIYLGSGSYGVAAAALNYFNKSLDELTLEETAYLAALPKAPNNYHPVRNREDAVARRNWVLQRLVEDGRIDPAEAEAASAMSLLVRASSPAPKVDAPYFAEEVRRQLVERYGEAALYEGGMSVRTTLEPRLQELAQRTLRQGLLVYDRRHGWRGPLRRIAVDGDWPTALRQLKPSPALGDWRLAVVLDVAKTRAEIGFADDRKGIIPLKAMAWARPWLKGQKLGPKVRGVGDVLAPGDVVAVSRQPEDKSKEQLPLYRLEQIPKINGAIIAMDPHTGRVLAMVGGFSYGESVFNRATQARRQPGSAFKPFVYAAALEQGFTPSSLILDAPFVIDQGPALGKWKPSNYTKKFYGPSTLRLGIEKSRNLMTVRLAQYIGMPSVVNYAKRFGIVDEMPAYLPMALGAAETTLLRLTTAYSMLVNGGKRIVPSLIDRIQDRRGQTIFRHDQRLCSGCLANAWNQQAEPLLPDLRQAVIAPSTAYQVVSMLEGVVLRGTGRRIAAVGKPLAGKTGTTNESRDTWFMGFSPDLAVGVYAGFDEPATLGRRETGSSVTAPMFRDFMAEALADAGTIPFRIPPDVKLIRVNGKTGLPAAAGAKHVIYEAFRPGTEPKTDRSVLDGSETANAGGASPRSGTGGLY